MRKLLRILIGALLVLVAVAGVSILLLFFLSQGPWDKKISEKERLWGVTFSAIYTRQLGLPVEETYLALLDELSVKHIRLPIYWNEVEPEEGRFDFSLYDWFLDRAEERGASVILTIGRRVPRWPECHAPAWAKNIAEAEQQQKVLSLLEAEVSHFKERKNVWAWQVENEPFILFFWRMPESRRCVFRGGDRAGQAA